MGLSPAWCSGLLLLVSGVSDRQEELVLCPYIYFKRV